MLGGMGPLLESPPRLFFKSGLQPLAIYGTHQETIGRRPEQMYAPSDTRLEWPKERLLFELDSNKCSGGALLKTFQVHFGVSRFTLEWLHCLH